MKEFGGDADRVYLTGLSMGGYGTWYLAGQFPERFAAIAPVCGGVRGPAAFPQLTMSRASDPYAEIARKVARLPIWIFHGEKDASVPVEESRRMHAALRALGADVRYSEYPGVGHDSWNNAYTEPGFLPWLLGQSKKKNRGTR
jgi:predicted peptidase